MEVLHESEVTSNVFGLCLRRRWEVYIAAILRSFLLNSQPSQGLSGGDREGEGAAASQAACRNVTFLVGVPSASINQTYLQGNKLCMEWNEAGREH